jgi:Tfp pilus assembly protein PilX
LPKLRRQDGFTLILALLVLLITALMLVAAFTAANGEIHLTSTDTAQKKAFYAAEAGLEDYEYQLTQDGNYLTYCTRRPRTVCSPESLRTIDGRSDGHERRREVRAAADPREIRRKTRRLRGTRLEKSPALR